MWALLLTGLSGCGGPKHQSGPVEPGDTGSASGDSDCTDPEPLVGALAADCWEPGPRCGGDPTGLWVSDTFCNYYDGWPASSITYGTSALYCEDDAVLEVLGYVETLDLGSDGGLSLQVDMSYDATWTVPADCLATLGYADCSALAQGNGLGFGCAPAADGCVCTSGDHGVIYHAAGTWSTCGAAITYAFDTITGTYSSSGDTSVTTVTGEGAAWDFCVDEDTLRTFSPFYDFGSGFHRVP